eukprot:1686912-Rhodomonas_salina.3
MPGRLLAITHAIAPAAPALEHLCWNGHSPRRSNATFPAMSAALRIEPQPRLASSSSDLTVTSSCPTTMSRAACGPNCPNQTSISSTGPAGAMLKDIRVPRSESGYAASTFSAAPTEIAFLLTAGEFTVVYPSAPKLPAAKTARKSGCLYTYSSNSSAVLSYAVVRRPHESE